MIPIRDENPTRRFPVVTTALLVANVLAFLYMLALDEGGLMATITEWAFTPARFIAEPLSPAVLATFISAMFMHGGWLHLGSNMLYLWIFGNNVEDALGPVRFAGFYVTSGIVATVAHMAIGG
ncbi:MAG TPA: rhomboid family intramembrane serine protease, partial [Coriobacteriia bacterium]|nr:rhomboid family intramembrane serine protease [Coriobacteriia bacterium]